MSNILNYYIRSDLYLLSNIYLQIWSELRLSLAVPPQPQGPMREIRIWLWIVVIVGLEVYWEGICGLQKLFGGWAIESKRSCPSSLASTPGQRYDSLGMFGGWWCDCLFFFQLDIVGCELWKKMIRSVGYGQMAIDQNFLWKYDRLMRFFTKYLINQIQKIKIILV